MTGEEKLKNFCRDMCNEKVIKINERVYFFQNFGISNAVAVIGDSSVILIDSLDSEKRGERLKAEIAAITPKPVKTIIYTHSHPDHRGGSGAFMDSVKEIVDFSPKGNVLPHYKLINSRLNKRSARQFGYELSDREAISEGIGRREGRVEQGDDYFILVPTITYTEDRVERDIDGVKIIMDRAPGETDDRIYVWLPRDRVLCSGDNYYGCWPNTYAIRGTQYRDVAGWVESLRKIPEYRAQYLLPGHTDHIEGQEKIKEVISAYAGAIEYVMMQTFECISAGLSRESAAHSIKLPREYIDLPFLGEYYGTVAWTVKGIYSGYIGWFDGDAVKLMPAEETAYNKTLLEIIDDNTKILNKIDECVEKDDIQTALQLTELMLSGGTSSNLLMLKKELLLKRAAQQTSANARHYYIAAAKELGV